MATAATLSFENSVYARRQRDKNQSQHLSPALNLSLDGGSTGISTPPTLLPPPRRASACSSMYSQSTPDSRLNLLGPSPFSGQVTQFPDVQAYKDQVNEASELLATRPASMYSNSCPPTPLSAYIFRESRRLGRGSSEDDTIPPVPSPKISPKDLVSPASEPNSNDEGFTFFVSPASSDAGDIDSVSDEDEADAITITSAKSDATSMGNALETSPDPLFDHDTVDEGWSEAVRQLIKETDLAFDGGCQPTPDHFDDMEYLDTIDIPLLIDEYRRSDPELNSRLAPSPLLIEKDGRKQDDEQDDEPLRSPRDSRRQSGSSSRRQSVSLPPAIRTRGPESPPPGTSGPAREYSQAPQLTSQFNKTRPLNPSDFIHRVQRHATAHLRRPSKSGRWAIPGQVSGIFSGNVFRRGDVDELLTADQLKMLNMRREAIRQNEDQAKSRRDLKDISISRPIEVVADSRFAKDDTSLVSPRKSSSSSFSSTFSSFHKRRNLSEGTNSSQGSGMMYRIDEEESAQNSGPFPVHNEDKPPLPPRKSKYRGISLVEKCQDWGSHFADDVEAGPSSKANDRPDPPPKDPRRSLRDSKGLPALPTPALPEGSRLHIAHLIVPEGKASRLEQENKPEILSTDERTKLFSSEEKDDHLYLKSTPYSMAAPKFRHGPITLPKSELGRGAPTMDETLDWTAFQMAILGASDLADDSDDSDSRIMDDVTTWFNEFGFETYGVLITEPEDRPRHTFSHSSSNSSISSTSSFGSAYLPIQLPVTEDYTKKMPLTTPLGQLPLGDRSKSPRSSATTQPLVVGDDIADEEDAASAAHQGTGNASLGSNLQSDLGDFLRWESRFNFGGEYHDVM